MKKLLAMLLLAGTTAQAAFVPVAVTHQNMAPVRNVDVRTRTAQAIADRAAQGYHYATVDMDDTTWKEEKAIMKELQAAGYEVDFGNSHHTYGWNAINGALIIRWVPRHEESWFPLFSDK